MLMGIDFLWGFGLGCLIMFMIMMLALKMLATKKGVAAMEKLLLKAEQLKKIQDITESKEFEELQEEDEERGD